MDNRVKDLWVQALRSGEYRQTKNYLSTDDGYCCLGVLCEVAIADGLEIDCQDYGTVFYDGEDAILPQSVQEWADLGQANPSIDWEADDVCSLAELNDHGGTFDEIALVIEEQL